ncbi:hypothetical protein BCR34DRAFT_608186 [Clohesyomyces aquaticus]|uniref:Uncharacterized protein n=1 Tax=Clohesyomyces aquaticus TaxID=1231657 RepID=A0A1Y1Y9P4_9PLEO|nr:hypothetical protein BCR34DRAFT_608186 [Clohesyomyces aquaticus]
MFNHYVAKPNNNIITAVRNPAGAQDLIKHLRVKGIDHIDVVISSAGIAKLNTVEDVPLEDDTPLLRKGEKPRFAFISAASGSIIDMPKYPYPNVSYTASKALANVVVHTAGMENEWLITLCIHPGLVQTDMGNMGARAFGLEEAPTTLENGRKNTAFLIDNETNEEHSEKFYNETIDQIHPW